MIKANTGTATKEKSKLLSWQSVVVLMVLLLSITLLLPENNQEATSLNGTKDKTTMEEMVSSAGQ